MKQNFQIGDIILPIHYPKESIYYGYISDICHNKDRYYNITVIFFDQEVNNNFGLFNESQLTKIS